MASFTPPSDAVETQASFTPPPDAVETKSAPIGKRVGEEVVSVLDVIGNTPAFLAGVVGRATTAPVEYARGKLGLVKPGEAATPMERAEQKVNRLLAPIQDPFSKAYHGAVGPAGSGVVGQETLTQQAFGKIGKGVDWLATQGKKVGIDPATTRWAADASMLLFGDIAARGATNMANAYGKASGAKEAARTVQARQQEAYKAPPSADDILAGIKESTPSKPMELTPTKVTRAAPGKGKATMSYSTEGEHPLKKFYEEEAAWEEKKKVEAGEPTLSKEEAFKQREGEDKQAKLEADVKMLEDQWKGGGIQQTAFRNKKTGEVETSGTKHDLEKKKDDNLEQGFVTQDGKFVDRKEADKIARETGQISQDHKLERPEEGLHSGDIRGTLDDYLKQDELGKWKLKNPPPENMREAIINEMDKRNSQPSRMGGVGKKQGGAVGITKTEAEYFKDAGFFEEFPDVEVINGKLHVPEHLKEQVSTWIEDSVGTQLGEGHKLPPRFYSGKLTKEIVLDKPLGQYGFGKGQRGAVDPSIFIEAARESIKLGKDLMESARDVYKKHGEEATRLFIVAYQNARNESSLKTTSDVADRLFRINSGGEATQTILRQNYEQAVRAGLDKTTTESILDKYGKGQDVSPEQEAIISKFFDPLKKEINDLYKEANAINPEAAKEFMDDSGLNRLAIHTGKWKDFFAGLYEGNFGGFGAYGAKPSAMKGRTIFKLGDKVVSRIGDDIFAWNNGEAEYLGSSRQALKAGDDFKGQKITDVMDQREIEANVPNVHYADPFFAHTVKLAEMRKYVDQMKALEELKNSEVGQTMMRQEGENIPENFRKLQNTNLVPQLRNMYLDPRLAEVLEDYLRPGAPMGSIGSVLEKLNGMAVKSFMLIPFPHMGNELAHYFVGRGLWEGWINPRGLKETGNIREAMASVLNQDKLQIEIARNGGSLLSMSIRNNNWMKKIMDSEIKAVERNTKGGLSSIALQIGMPVKKFYDMISNASNMAMWTMRDGLYTSMIMERMNRYGEAMPQAIAHVDKFMPNYRLPSRIGMDNLAGRFISNTMQSKAATVFSRYHYGMVRAIAEAIKDLKTKGKRAEGLDHIAAYAAGLYLVYPAIDWMYQQTFGEDVKSRRQGGFHLLDNMMKVARGEKQPEAVVSSLITPSPALSMGYSALTNRDYFSGQNIRTPGDTAAGQAYDVTKYFGTKQMPMAGLTDVATGKKTGKEWAYSQMDAEYESEDKKRKKLRAERIHAKAEETAKNKRKKDPLAKYILGE